MALLHQGNHPTELGLFAWTFAWNQQTFEERGNSFAKLDTHTHTHAHPHTHVLHLQVCSICTHLNNVGLDFSHCMLAFKSNCLETKIKFIHIFLSVLVTHSCSSFCQSVDCSQPSISVHGIIQAKIVEWVAMPSSRGSLGHRVESASLCTWILYQVSLHGSQTALILEELH